MKREISIDDIDNIAKGAALLGSGGGGDPHYEIGIAKNQIIKYGNAQLIDLEDLNDDDLILPVGFVGAPMVVKEKIQNNIMFETVLKQFERYYGKLPAAVFSCEIGGANSLAPLLFASRNNLKILDGDLIGRAYPEIQMTSANLCGISCSPGFLGDFLGNGATVTAENAKDLERISRHITVACGSAVAVGIYTMTCQEAKKAMIKKTVTQAMEIGKIINQKLGIDTLLEKTKGKFIANGTIIDIQNEISGGFMKGICKIKSNDKIYQIDFQNEYLAVYCDESLIGCTPDIIGMLDQSTMLPIASESLTYGLRVSLLTMPSNNIWYSEEGLKLVGPSVFKIKG